MKKLLILIFMLPAILFAQNQEKQYSIIPKPVHIKMTEKTFTFGESTKIVVNLKDVTLVEAVSSSIPLIETTLDMKIPIVGLNYEDQEGNIVVSRNAIFDKELGTEGYELIIKNENIYLNANTEKGIFYGINTLWQIVTSTDYMNIPCGEIRDYPRFAWRGLHLDVSRHFFPVEFIYKYIDYIAMHKLNVFHWHLIDDQGWRLEIKKYPKLTEIGAWRVNKEDLPWNNRPLIKRGETADFGGFYTQEEIKAIVEYARKKQVSIVPEIEMPAHVMSALAGYPELSCTKKDLGVPPGGVWPITHIYCAGNDEVFNFLENVLTEVFSLFPSTYIHIGGDEAFKDEWKTCDKCKQRMKIENLDDVEELQSYFIKRIEKYINKNGRKLIGWDEILEGGLAPEATVMSWRGEKGGIKAAKERHNVVMTPGTHCYFDHYQGFPKYEPYAIGGYTTLKKVYHYNPVPKKLSSKYEKYILGAQANVWTEYMETPEHVEYMIFPRLSALSEVLWSEEDNKDWGNFINRLEEQYKRYDNMDINYSNSSYQVKIDPKYNSRKKHVKVELSCELPNVDIRYTLDGTEPTFKSAKYNKEEPIIIDKTADIRALVLKNEKKVIEPIERKITLHNAFGKDVKFKHYPAKEYRAGGNEAIVDGIFGTLDHKDGFWLGFLGKDMEVTIDLEEEKQVDSISVEALQSINSWIFYPKHIEVEGSTDGKTYTSLGKVINDISTNILKRSKHTFVIPINKKTRYIKVKAKNIKECPKGHYAEGEKSWMFIDEIIVE